METKCWQRHLRVGRFQVSCRLLRHRYVTGSDRWVLQPNVVYDRKQQEPWP